MEPRHWCQLSCVFSFTTLAVCRYKRKGNKSFTIDFVWPFFTGLLMLIHDQHCLWVKQANHFAFEDLIPVRVTLGKKMTLNCIRSSGDFIIIILQ